MYSLYLKDKYLRGEGKPSINGVNSHVSSTTDTFEKQNYEVINILFTFFL